MIGWFIKLRFIIIGYSLSERTGLPEPITESSAGTVDVTPMPLPPVQPANTTLSESSEVIIRKGGYIGLFITLVPKVLVKIITFYIHYLTTLVFVQQGRGKIGKYLKKS